jgi:muramoyltetrapeptide carboxypeptidase LdcA involved in peptidoglycan recycling
MKMRYPEFIKKGDTIGFIAPSFGCNIEPYKTAFNSALENFRERGFDTKLGPNCYAGEGIGISNTPEKCAAEVNDFFTDEDVAALISCGGGELMCEILPYVDFEALKSAPAKWFMGYSDNTNLTFLLTTICDTASIYGPCASSFGQEKWHESIEDAQGLLRGEKLTVTGYGKWERESLKNEDNPLATYNVTEPTVLRAFPENFKVEGRLVGGCMDCLVNLIGTKFDRVKEFLESYKEDGFIWFLESCDLNVMSIRRAMWQMDAGGWFKYCKGFIIGRPLVFGQELMGLDQYEAVMGILRKYKVPVVMDADIGHLAPQMPLICGSMAKLTVEDNSITVDMKLN